MVENRKINPWTWQDAFGFSQAIETTGHKRVLRCSGQTSVERERRADARRRHRGAGRRWRLDNLEAVLKAADMTLANVVRLNLYTHGHRRRACSTTAVLAERPGRGWQCSPPSRCSAWRGCSLPELMIEMEADAVA